MTTNPQPPEGGNRSEDRQFTPEETQAYISQLREENKARRLREEAALAQLEQLRQAQEQAEQDWLKEQGQFKELYEKADGDRKTMKSDLERAKVFESAFQSNLQARIAALPEGIRGLVPEGLDPIALSNWLDKATPVLTRPKAPNLNPGAGEGGAGGTPEGEAVELNDGDRKVARKMNLTDAQYAEIKKKREGQPKTPPK